MRRYHQLTSGERYALSALRKQGLTQGQIARTLGRHPSTISRELRRNSRKDGAYRPSTADQRARASRSRSRRNTQFGWSDWALVVSFLGEDWSPEQIAGRLISERPPGAENRSRIGHFEGDTVMGSSADKHCVLTLVDRKSGYLMVGKLTARTVAETNRTAIALIRRAQRKVRTLTVDHGTEFHGYKEIEAATGSRFYFATPYHSWERETSENTNGLIRQYLPKRQSMAHITQRRCNRIARKLNRRPRKRLGYLTPEECYEKEL